MLIKTKRWRNAMTSIYDPEHPCNQKQEGTIEDMTGLAIQLHVNNGVSTDVQRYDERCVEERKQRRKRSRA